MCGIIGIISNHPVVKDLLSALKRLEYRGYDSAGIAILNNTEIKICKSVGKVSHLEQKIDTISIDGTIGIAHTRWATHGEPNEQNAHPHVTDKVAIVHNGIIENYLDLRKKLKNSGIQTKTSTDSEVFALLLTHELSKGVSKMDAIINSVTQIKGSYAFAIIFNDDPEHIYGIKNSSPLVIGKNSEGFSLGSDAISLANLAKKISFLQDGDIAVISKDKSIIYNSQKIPVNRPFEDCAEYSKKISKNEYQHFMLKEIYEQPDVVKKTLENYVDFKSQEFKIPYLGIDIKNIKRITIIACGTSYYAALVAKYWFEAIAEISVDLDIASEYRYRKMPMSQNGPVLFISQSGETADTIAAIKHAQANNQYTLGISNVPNSTISRIVDISLLTFAGPEIGVASTKAFMTQLSVLCVLALYLATIRKSIKNNKESYFKDIQNIPNLIKFSLEQAINCKNIAKNFKNTQNMLYLGRGIMFPIALEGALKIKEISYIHAEGYAAGEMKHGPIALIDENLPVITIAPHNELFEKIISNLQEVSARKGKTVIFTDMMGASKYDLNNIPHIILPKSTLLTSPFIYTIPVQLLAYYAALARGNDVDQPRNLAKSVTVE